MAERAATIAELTLDYSDDELDAVADLFDRRVFAQRRQRDPDRDERTRRAVADAMLRALAARRALVLEGSPARPRVRLLEPHATVLDPFVAPEVEVHVVEESALGMRAWSLYARGEVVVERRALPGEALSRLTARPRVAAAPVPLPHALFEADDAAQPARVEVTLRQFERADAAVTAGMPPPAGVPKLLGDVLYARTASATVILTARSDTGVVEHERWSWLAAGRLGLWRVSVGPGRELSTVFIEVVQPQEFRAELARGLAAIAGALPD